MDVTLAAALIQAGPIGIFALYLIWEKRTNEKERLRLDRERLEVDRNVAASLAALTAVVQRRNRNGG
jgi:hypothetical protein